MIEPASSRDALALSLAALEAIDNRRLYSMLVKP